MTDLAWMDVLAAVLAVAVCALLEELRRERDRRLLAERRLEAANGSRPEAGLCNGEHAECLSEAGS